MLVFSLLFVGFGCNSTSVTENKEPKGEISKPPVTKEIIKFAYIAMVQTTPQALINMEDKIFEEQLQELGKKVEFVSTRSLDNIWPMMDSDSVDPDFVYIPTANFSTYITETSRFGGSNKYAIVAGSNGSNSTVLIVNPEIKSLKDLDGKKVGIANQRYQDEFQFNKVLNTVGLSTDSVGGSVKVFWDDIVLDLITNFSKGDYDAIVLYAPANFPVALAKVPGSKILTTLNPDELFGKAQPRNWLIAKKDLIKNDPELVKVVLKAHVMATEGALADIDKLAEINREVYLDYFRQKTPEIEAMLKQHTPEFYKKKWKETEITYDPNMNFITENYEFIAYKGLMKGKTIDDFVQIKLLNDVLKEMGKEPF